MLHPFNEPVIIIRCFLSENTVKTEHYLKNIHKCDKKKSQFCQSYEHLFQTVKVNLSEATPFSKTCDHSFFFFFFGDFWGAKIVKRNISWKIFTNVRTKYLKSQFCQNQKLVFQKARVNLSDATPFSKSCDDL